MREPRAEEAGYVEKKRIYGFRPIEVCFLKTGQASVSTRWVDTNKRDEILVRYPE